jgi:hypothetical protein
VTTDARRAPGLVGNSMAPTVSGGHCCGWWQVWEVSCPDRSYRRKGKSHPVDADSAARAVLARDVTAIPKDPRGFMSYGSLMMRWSLTATPKASVAPASRLFVSAWMPAAVADAGCGCRQAVRYRSGYLRRFWQ